MYAPMRVRVRRLALDMNQLNVDVCSSTVYEKRFRLWFIICLALTINRYLN